MEGLITQTTSLQVRGASKIEQKKYPKTLKSCISLEEFEDLLNQKINEHYNNSSKMVKE